MGFGGISIWQLLIVLVIVLLLFGTKKLRGLGGDVGTAIKSFRKAMKEDDSAEKRDEAPTEESSDELKDDPGEVIEGEVSRASRDKA